MPENAFNLYIKRELPLKNLFKNLHFWLSVGTPYNWARTKVFWIWVIYTLEGCVLLWTCLILKKVQIWNTLIHTLKFLILLIIIISTPQIPYHHHYHLHWYHYHHMPRHRQVLVQHLINITWYIFLKMHNTFQNCWSYKNWIYQIW